MTTGAEQLLAALRRDPRKLPYDKFLDLLRAGESGEIAEFVLGYLDEFEEGVTLFSDALGHLDEPAFARAIARVLEPSTRDRLGNSYSAAREVLNHAAMEVPHLLAPHLRGLRHLLDDPDTPSGLWRAADKNEREWLLQALSEKPEWGQVAQALLSIRHESHITAVLASRWASDMEPTDLLDHIRLAGMEPIAGGGRQLAPDKCFHLVLSDEHLADRRAGPSHLHPDIHPTWSLPADGAALMGGTATTGRCGVCHEPLHRLLTLDPVPAGLGVSLDALELATCLRCLGWSDDARTLAYQHDTAGRPEPLIVLAERQEPEFDADPLLEGTVGLAPTPPRWRLQDVESSNHRQNLHRLGGEPTWIQYPDYLTCPNCSATMTALLQLDSDLRMEGGGEFLWGSGGIGYVSWCDACAISAAQWQCT